MAGWKRISGTKKELILTLFLAVLLAACAAPSEVTPTGLATRRVTWTPAATSTRTPYPATPTSPPMAALNPHTWQPQPVLIEFDFTCGDGCGGPRPAYLTLFSTGALFTYKWSNESLDYILQETTLSRRQICEVLNTIDQNGFFQYDPAVYDDPPINWPNSDSGGGSIEVNAWSAKHIYHTAPRDFVFGDGLAQFEECEACGQPPSILSSFANTFKLLYFFEPADLRPSSFETTAFFIEQYPPQLALTYSGEPWIEAGISLPETLANSSCSGMAVFEMTGDAAIHLRAVIGRGGGVFNEDGQVFSVNYRRLLPGEEFPGCDIESIYADPNQTMQTPANLSCSPEDGLLPIPEP